MNPVFRCLLFLLLTMAAWPRPLLATHFPKTISFPGARLNLDTRKLFLNGWFCLEQGNLEFLATTPEGKTHETLLVLASRPSDLTALLLLMGVAPAGMDYQAGVSVMPGLSSQLVFTLSWTAEERPRIKQGVWTAPSEEKLEPVYLEDDRELILLYEKQPCRFWATHHGSWQESRWGGPFALAAAGEPSPGFESRVREAWHSLKED